MVVLCRGALAGPSGAAVRLRVCLGPRCACGALRYRLVPRLACGTLRCRPGSRLACRTALGATRLLGRPGLRFACGSLAGPPCAAVRLRGRFGHSASAGPTWARFACGSLATMFTSAASRFSTFGSPVQPHASAPSVRPQMWVRIPSIGERGNRILSIDKHRVRIPSVGKSWVRALSIWRQKTPPDGHMPNPKSLDGRKPNPECLAAGVSPASHRTPPPRRRAGGAAAHAMARLHPVPPCPPAARSRPARQTFSKFSLAQCRRSRVLSSTLHVGVAELADALA